jgi:hypothetical protein
MKNWSKALVAATAFLAVAGSTTVSAKPPPWAHGWGKGGSKGAPGPVAGVGLPLLLIAGGYALVRRYRNRKTD